MHASQLQTAQPQAASPSSLLVDLIGLELRAKHAHWNVVRPAFRDLHLGMP
jgi:starvation-inducible DNA-binding protein